MDLETYQKLALSTAIYPHMGNNLTYPIVGLAGEAGEVCNKYGKVIRDDNWKLTDEKREALIDELGDVMWFAAMCAHELNVSLSDICERNIDKLKSRHKRNKLSGSGDKR